MAKSKLLLGLLGLLTFGIVLLGVGQFVGKDVKTKHAFTISSVKVNCNDNPLAGVSAICGECVGPEEIHWQQNAGNYDHYIGAPFAVKTNADCFRAPDNRVAMVLDTVLLYAMPFAVSVAAVYVIGKKGKRV